MEASPKVSIGLPVYNGEKYLEDALDAILAQTHRDFELIICDNASTDRTQEICLKYAKKDKRIHYHRNERNLGAAPNFNLAFRMAQGKYFKWATYDDQMTRDFLSKCVEAMDKHPDVVLCMPMTTLIDEKGKPLRNFDYGKAKADFEDPRRRFRNFLLYNMSGNFVFGLLRRDAVAQTTLHGSYTSSDLVFLAELTLYGRVHVLPEYLFLRRDHPEQSTKGIWKSERARPVWFDSSLKGKIVLPKWRFLFSSLNAVRKAPLSVSDRLVCYMYVVKWIASSRHFLALGKDIVVAIQKLILRFYWGLSQPSVENSGKPV